jgi:hypothetical protein
MKYIIGQDRTQLLLIPDCLEYQISQDNEVRIIDIFVAPLKQKSAHIRPLLFGLNQTEFFFKSRLKSLTINQNMVLL